jgi:hypothetical protein
MIYDSYIYTLFGMLILFGMSSTKLLFPWPINIWLDLIGDLFFSLYLPKFLLFLFWRLIGSRMNLPTLCVVERLGMYARNLYQSLAHVFLWRPWTHHIRNMAAYSLIHRTHPIWNRQCFNGGTALQHFDKYDLLISVIICVAVLAINVDHLLQNEQPNQIGHPLVCHLRIF